MFPRQRKRRTIAVELLPRFPGIAQGRLGKVSVDQNDDMRTIAWRPRSPPCGLTIARPPTVVREGPALPL